MLIAGHFKWCCKPVDVVFFYRRPVHSQVRMHNMFAFSRLCVLQQNYYNTLLLRFATLLNASLALKDQFIFPRPPEAIQLITIGLSPTYLIFLTSKWRKSLTNLPTRRAKRQMMTTMTTMDPPSICCQEMERIRSRREKIPKMARKRCVVIRFWW